MKYKDNRRMVDSLLAAFFAEEDGQYEARHTRRSTNILIRLTAISIAINVNWEEERTECTIAGNGTLETATLSTRTAVVILDAIEEMLT